MIQRSFLNVHGFWISIVNLSYYYLGFWFFVFFLVAGGSTLELSYSDKL